MIVVAMFAPEGELSVVSFQLSVFSFQFSVFSDRLSVPQAHPWQWVGPRLTLISFTVPIENGVLPCLY
jgi:hypothetical protein